MFGVDILYGSLPRWRTRSTRCNRELCPALGCEAGPTLRELRTEPSSAANTRVGGWQTIQAADPLGALRRRRTRRCLPCRHAEAPRRGGASGEGHACFDRIRGSLLVSALMSFNDHAWPGSAAYLERTYPALRNLLTTVDLFTVGAIGWRGLLRFNRRILTHRASVLADLLAERWGVTGRVRDLPRKPRWLINTTSLHSGKCWRFSARKWGTGCSGATTPRTSDWRMPQQPRRPCRTSWAHSGSTCPRRVGSRRIPPPASR